MNTKCPYCSIATDVKFSELSRNSASNSKFTDVVESGRCTSCKKLIVKVRQEFTETTGNVPKRKQQLPNKTGIVFPIETKSLFDISTEVPEELKEDYFEAVNTLKVSPKASATMSRRCLQNFFHNHLEPSIKKRGLADEIEAYIGLAHAPKHILSAVDYIRHIGNYGAHPKKSLEVDKMMKVEPGEAEWSIVVLQMIFEFYYEMKEKIEKEKNDLTVRFEAEGKSINWKVPE